MKIAMIGHKRIPSREGGVEIVVGELSKRMTALGNNVTAYNRDSEHIAGKDYGTSHSNEWEGVRIKWIKTPNSSKLNAIVYSFFATLSAIFGGYDVIHFHAEGPCAMIPLAKLFGKRCIATIHGLDWQRSKWGGFATNFLKHGEKMAVKYADEIIVLSKNMKSYFFDNYNRSTIYIPNGVSEPEIKDPKIIADKFDLKKDDYILFLGRIVPEKCVHLLIDAYNQIETEKKLVIAGGASHTSDYENKVKEQAKGNPNIIFTGFVEGDELNELYSNAYIYCLPSDVEGMPISLLEAMSYGNCCLTSSIRECTEVCGSYAESFKKSSLEDLVYKLNELLNNDELVSDHKAATKEYVLGKYNWDDITKKTLELYKK